MKTDYNDVMDKLKKTDVGSKYEERLCKMSLLSLMFDIRDSLENLRSPVSPEVEELITGADRVFLLELTALQLRLSSLNVDSVVGMFDDMNVTKFDQPLPMNVVKKVLQGVYSMTIEEMQSRITEIEERFGDNHGSRNHEQPYGPSQRKTGQR